LVSVYASQSGRTREQKEDFFMFLGQALSSFSTGERLLVCGDLNGHVLADVDGFEGLRSARRICFGSCNVEDEILVKLYDPINLGVANTWLKKGDSNLVTYESGGCWMVVDYIWIQQNEKSILTNAKSIPESRVLIYLLRGQDNDVVHYAYCHSVGLTA